MAISEIVKTWFGSNGSLPIRERALSSLSDAPSLGGLLGLQMPQPAGRNLDRTSLLQSVNLIPPFRSAVHTVARHVSSVPWFAERNGEQLDEHPILDLLKSPNTEHTWRQFCQLMVMWKLVTGDGHAVIAKTDAPDRDLELLPFPPNDVKREQVGKDAWAWQIDHNNMRETVHPDAMLWLRDINVLDPYGRGHGFGQVLVDELEITEFAARHQKSEFANRGIPAFIAYVQGAGDAETKSFAEKWRRATRGPDQQGRGLFLGGPQESTAIVKQMQRSLADMNVSELRDASHRIIERTLGISPEILGRIENSNRATSEQARTIFAENQTIPQLTDLAQMLNDRLVPLFGDESLALGFEDPRPRQRTFQLEVMKTKPEAFTVNEWRDLADMPARADGDIYLRPPNTRQTEQPAADVDISRHAPEIDDDERHKIIDVDFRISTKIGETEAAEISSQITADILEGPTGAEYERQLERWYRLREGDWIADEERQWQSHAYFKQGDDEDAPDDPDAPPPLATDPSGLPLSEAPLPLQIQREIQDEKHAFLAEKVQQINRTTKANIEIIVEEGLQAGENPLTVARRLQDLHLKDIIPRRPETIARTEMNRAANWSSQRWYEQTKEITHKTWIARQDGATRNTHAKINGETIQKSERWETIDADGSAGKVSAAFPGDFGVAHLDINCRCAMSAAVERMSAAQVVRYWKNFDLALTQSEEAFAAVWRLAFEQQWIEQTRPAIERVLGVDFSDIDEASA